MSTFVERLDLGIPAGLRVGVKDTIDIAGWPTRAGSRALAEAPPASAHAEVVDRVLAAGCRIVGKTVLHELAFGVTGINDGFGTPPNPRFPGRMPGGSSSGSAVAVASGEADFAIGTDTGGSIRIPAACCGVWGLKPTFGRVSRRGVMPGRTTLDCVGPLAASVGMLARAMQILAPDFAPERVPGRAAGARVALLQGLAVGELDAAVRDAVQRGGLSVRPSNLQHLQAAFEAGLAVINAETFAAVGHLLPTGRVGTDVARRLEAASHVSASDLAEAERVRALFTAEVDAVLDDVEAIVLPTLPVFPPTVEAARDNRSGVDLTRLVRPFNLSGHPALALPLASASSGPISMQIVGRKGADEQVVGIARTIAETV